MRIVAQYSMQENVLSTTKHKPYFFENDFMFASSFIDFNFWDAAANSDSI